MAQSHNEPTREQAPRTLAEYLTNAHAEANSPRVRQALAELKPAFKY